MYYTTATILNCYSKKIYNNQITRKSWRHVCMCVCVCGSKTDSSLKKRTIYISKNDTHWLKIMKNVSNLAFDSDIFDVGWHHSINFCIKSWGGVLIWSLILRTNILTQLRILPLEIGKIHSYLRQNIKINLHKYKYVNFMI